MDVFRDEFVLHVEDMLSHDVRVDDAREAGSDPFDISLHGSALPGTFEYYLGLSRRFRTVAGASEYKPADKLPTAYSVCVCYHS